MRSLFTITAIIVIEIRKFPITSLPSNILHEILDFSDPDVDNFKIWNLFVRRITDHALISKEFALLTHHNLARHSNLSTWIM